LKVTIRNTAGSSTKVRVYIGGVLYWDLSQSPAVYTEYTTDVTLDVTRNDIISVQMRKGGGVQSQMKDFEICGKRSLAVLD
jgi:hypothetical protein